MQKLDADTARLLREGDLVVATQPAKWQDIAMVEILYSKKEYNSIVVGYEWILNNGDVTDMVGGKVTAATFSGWYKVTW